MKTAIVFVVLLMMGCATNTSFQSEAPTAEQMAAAQFSPAISTEDVENHIRNTTNFFDPYSAVIHCENRGKSWWIHDYELFFSWIYVCTQNAKNRFGAYVGEQRNAYRYNFGRIGELPSVDKIGYYDN